MVREVRVYIEGGGGGKDSRGALRRGFGEFLSSLRERARENHVGWKLIACGSRNDAFEAFQWAFEAHPGAFNVLLVDSEGPVTEPPDEHLRRQDGWSPKSLPDGQCHLMAQAMEAWFLADPEELEKFFGTGFRPAALPGRRNVEEIPKKAVLDGLEKASRESGKGKYHKIHHGAELLRRISPEKVRTRARHCDRLFLELESRLSR